MTQAMHKGMWGEIGTLVEIDLEESDSRTSIKRKLEAKVRALRVYPPTRWQQARQSHTHRQTPALLSSASSKPMCAQKKFTHRGLLESGGVQVSSLGMMLELLHLIEARGSDLAPKTHVLHTHWVAGGTRSSPPHRLGVGL